MLKSIKVSRTRKYKERVSEKGSEITLRKEVIQPHLPVRLPCYDLAPVTSFTLDSSPPIARVRILASGTPGFHGLTGGVYKARERIHRGVLIRDY
jgi:hypothetical protein